MRKTIWMLLAGLSFAVAGPAMAGGSVSGDSPMGSTVAAISGHWAQQGAECDGDADSQMRISAEGDTLTINLGEASADETIDSDRAGVLTTHSDEGRFRYAIDGEDLVITNLGDRSVERLTPCGPDEDSASEGAQAGKAGGDADEDDDADEAGPTKT